jgi:hypothetical protein
MDRTHSRWSWFALAASEEGVRGNTQKIDHHGNHVPYNHPSLRNQEAVVEANNLRNTNDARQHNDHALT